MSTFRDATSQNGTTHFTDASDQRAPQLTVLSLVNIALRSRYLIAGLSVASLLVVAFVSLRRPRSYSSTASFVTQTSKPASNLAGLAAQFGVSVAQGDPGMSPAFYLDLVRSRGVLASIAESTYHFTGNGQPVATKLDRVFDVDGANPGQRRESTIRELRDRITTSLNQRTGMVTFIVRSPNPELSLQLATQMLSELNQFNLERRQSQAAMERRFAQARLGQVESELRASEDRMQAFLQRNHGDYRGSPSLTFEAERLQRDIGIRQQVFAGLSQSLEQAKMDEVRDTPVITVVEAPELPVEPDTRGLGRRGIVALGLGALLGFVVALAGAWFGQARVDARDEVEEFNRLRDELWFDLRHPLGALRRTSRSAEQRSA